MSKHINVNPDHYKVAGRERQGENVVHGVEKREMARLRREERRIPPSQKAQTADKARRTPQAQETTKKGKRSMATVKGQRQAHTGISNRAAPEDEARERQQHPPVDTSSPPPEDAAGRIGERPLSDRRDRHTSHKAGSRSIAQKEAGARYPDRSMPPARKVAGAFGREPQRVSAASADAGGVVRRGRSTRSAKARKKR